MATQPSPKIMIRKNSKGIPVPGSNSKKTVKPTGNWDIITAVVNGASDYPRLRFPGNKRYFVSLDSQGYVIDGSLFESATVPTTPHLEVFANGLITLSDDAATNPGVVPEDPETLLSIPVLVSEDYRKNGSLLYSKPKDTTFPNITITSPANGAVFPVNSQITVTAVASDNVGISYCYFIFNSMITTYDYTAPYSATFTMPATPSTNVPILAAACDTSGNTRIVRITVQCQ
jgi:hypothetical protein